MHGHLLGPATLGDIEGQGYLIVSREQTEPRTTGVFVVRDVELPGVGEDGPVPSKPFSGPVYENDEMEIRDVEVVVYSQRTGPQGRELHLMPEEEWDQQDAASKKRSRE